MRRFAVAPEPRVLWTCGGLALAALLYFDLGPPLAFNDDWQYAWTVRRLISGHGLQMVPEQSATAMVQVLWAALATLGHPDQRLLRLSVIPILLLAVVSCRMLARDLGADRFWAAAAGVALLATPLFLSVSTSFMTDVFYVGLLVAGAWAGARWLAAGRAKGWCVLLTALAVLERQPGAGLPLALTIGLLLARRSRPVPRREWLMLAATWLAAGAMLLLPSAIGVATAGQNKPRQVDPGFLLSAVGFLPGLLGVTLAPFLVALLFLKRDGHAQPRRRVLVVGVTVVAVALAVLIAIAASATLFPGNYWTRPALNPVSVQGNKPPLYPWPLFIGLEVIALVTLAALVMVRDHLKGFGRDPRVIFLLVLSATQLLPMLVVAHFDRYYLPVIAPMIPIAAALASRTQRAQPARWWAIAMALLGLGLYAAGEQDYQAWMVARDTTARLAYLSGGPEAVNAGFEANGVYWELPNIEPGQRSATAINTYPADSPAVVGPPHPRLRLEIARADDPRPGVSYASIAPGRIVIVPIP